MNAILRTTHACSITDLNPNLSAAMRAHIARFQLGDLESDILMCCETTTIKPKQDLFDNGGTTLSAVFLTSKWLVWAEGVNGKITAGSAQLRHIDIRQYEKTAMFATAPDQGFNITGRYTIANQTGQTFIGLDVSSDGQMFRQVLQEAMDKTPVH